MKSLPIFNDRREDAAACGPCGGKCCKSMPGIATPEDFGAPDRDVMQSRLREALSSGRWAIDWWEGDPRPDSHALDAAYFVRPATWDKRGTLYDPSWGGRCTFLGVKGCELEYDARPRNCRALIPRPGTSCVETDEDGGRVNKDRYAIAWIPYIGLLLSVAEEVRHAA